MKLIYSPKMQPGSNLREIVLAENVCVSCGEQVAKKLNDLNGVQSNYEACVVEDSYPVGRGMSVKV